MDLDAFTLELLQHQPAALADLVNGQSPRGNAPPQTDPNPVDNVPEWYNFGYCVVIPTQLEHKCCT